MGTITEGEIVQNVWVPQYCTILKTYAIIMKDLWNDRKKEDENARRKKTIYSRRTACDSGRI